jgi:hypothetical protein
LIKPTAPASLRPGRAAVVIIGVVVSAGADEITIREFTRQATVDGVLTVSHRYLLLGATRS